MAAPEHLPAHAARQGACDYYHGATVKETTMAMTGVAAQGRQQKWPAAITTEFQTNQFNGCVGTALLSETDRVRVWTIRLKPGERIGFHRHVLDYFWTAVTSGRAISHTQDGGTIERHYYAGETQHESYGLGESKIHDLQNVGDGDLIFTTVEFLDSANDPLPLPDAVRLGRRELSDAPAP
jgi:quercetin dioxygenase-like cupin family protein